MSLIEALIKLYPLHNPSCELIVHIGSQTFTLLTKLMPLQVLAGRKLTVFLLLTNSSTLRPGHPLFSSTHLITSASLLRPKLNSQPCLQSEKKSVSINSCILTEVHSALPATISSERRSPIHSALRCSLEVNLVPRSQTTFPTESDTIVRNPHSVALSINVPTYYKW